MIGNENFTPAGHIIKWFVRLKLLKWLCYSKAYLIGWSLINCWCFIFRISLIHYCISHTINQILLRKNLQCFEMIFIVILWKPNVLPGVRVCKTSMTNHLISKEEACCGKAPPEVYPTLSPGKSYPPMVPSVHGYHRQKVPLVHWYHRRKVPL